MKVSKVEKILELINRIHKIEKGMKIPLHNEFYESAIWKDIDLWGDLYNSLCKKKLKEIKKQKGPNILNFFNNVQKLITFNKDDEKIEIVNLLAKDQD